MKTIAVLSIWICTIPGTMAQLNQLDSTKLTVKFSCAGSLLEGNVSRLLLVNRLDLNYADQQWGFSNRSDYQYGQRNHQLSENDVVTYNFIYYQPGKKLYPFVMIIAETNYRRKIDFRYQAGPGITWSMVRKRGSLFRVSLTVTYEHTGFSGHKFENLSDTSYDRISTYRITPRLYGVQHIFQNKVNLVYELWWQQSVSSSANYRFFVEQGVEVPLIKHLDLKTTIRYTYENIRLKGLKAYDLFWVFGIVLKNN